MANASENSRDGLENVASLLRDALHRIENTSSRTANISTSRPSVTRPNPGDDTTIRPPRPNQNAIEQGFM